MKIKSDIKQQILELLKTRHTHHISEKAKETDQICDKVWECVILELTTIIEKIEKIK